MNIPNDKINVVVGFGICFQEVSCFFKKNFLFYIGVQLINNVVIVSGTQRSNSKFSSQPGCPHNIEQSPLCYTVGPGWLSILNIAVCTCPPPTPSLSLPSSLRTIILPAQSPSLSHPASMRWGIKSAAEAGLCHRAALHPPLAGQGASVLCPLPLFFPHGVP